MEKEKQKDGKYTTATYELRSNAFRDMIIYYRNNASILAWEIGNQTLPTSVAETMMSYIQRYDHGNRQYATVNGEGIYTYNSTRTKVNSGTYSATTASQDRLISMRQTNSSWVNYLDIGETTEGKGAVSGLVPVEGEYNRLEARRGVWDKFTLGYENFANTVPSGISEYINQTSESFALSQITKYVTMVGSTSHCGGANWIFSDSISHRKSKFRSI